MMIINAFMVCTTTLIILLCSSSSYASTAEPPSTTPTPAPAPGPAPVNLTELLSVAGPFSIFLNYLETTKIIQMFQAQANNTEEGITLFVPKDDAFKKLTSPSLANLTQEQLKQLILFHGLSHYYSLAEFKNLSRSNPISTFAGGQYTLNFTDQSGTIHIGSGWTNTVVSSSVHSTDPVAIYQIDKVLLPEAIFGTDIPPTPAPVPAPVTSPADTPTNADSNADSSPTNSPGKSSSDRIMGKSMIRELLVLAISGGIMVILL